MKATSIGVRSSALRHEVLRLPRQTTAGLLAFVCLLAAARWRRARRFIVGKKRPPALDVGDVELASLGLRQVVAQMCRSVCLPWQVAAETPSTSAKEASSHCATSRRDKRFLLRSPRKRTGSRERLVDLGITRSLVCSERSFEGRDNHAPARLVVFDFDETLSLSTFMLKGGKADSDQRDLFVTYNFQSPWVNGNRLESLRDMLAEMAKLSPLAVLSRNTEGVKPVLELLRLAELDQYFTAVWVMPWSDNVRNGAYRYADCWGFFDPPLKELDDHKADVVHDIAARPAVYFPHLWGKPGYLPVPLSPAAMVNPGRWSLWPTSPRSAECASPSASPIHQRSLFGPRMPAECPEEDVPDLLGLRPEHIVLVDDNRLNFVNSASGKEVLRYAKVARYDASYRAAGYLKNMGGLGAHDDDDYSTLIRFVREPWAFPEDPGVPVTSASS